ncbi:MAG: hypothetical protein NTW86_01505, partial [Candidatus Sumerlaeota bacterium]|nr:hypothetical protein [Candidatus Sumerlaeota bacterium]
IVLTGCSRGRLFGAALTKNKEAALEHLRALRRAVGRERVFVEVQPPADKAADVANRRLIELADHLETPVVATQNVQYIHKSEHLAAFLLERQDRERIAPGEWRQWIAERPPRHFADAAEMRSHFGWRPELLENTLIIAERCRFSSPYLAQHFPTQAASSEEETESALWGRVLEGIPLPPDPRRREDIKERLDREIRAIREAKLGAHLLFLGDLIGDLDDAGISHGPAQGVWLRSLAAYALRLSPLDPLEFHLPDPDWSASGEALPVYRLELAEDDVARARDLFAKRFGEERIARVGRYAPRRRVAVLRRLAKSVGASEAKLARLLAERPAAARRGKASGKSSDGNGNGHALEERLQIDDSAFLRRAADLLADHPERLRPDGQMVVFSGLDLRDAVPLVPLPDAGPTTQLDAEALDALSLPRVDRVPRPLMGVVALAARYVREQADSQFTLDPIPLDDAETYALLGTGQTNGMDELNTIGMKALLRASPPKSLIDLAALLQKRKGQAPPSAEGAADLTLTLPTALLGYWAAWLKRRHPIAFMAALLSRSVGAPKRFAIALRETRRLRIPVLPPDVNLSRLEFAPERRAIRAGLSVVRHFGERVYAEFHGERLGRPFDDLVDLCRRTDPRIVTHRAVSNLVKVGALDRFGVPRAHHLAQLDQIFRDVKTEREESKESGQLTLFDLETLERKRPGSDVRLAEVPEFTREQMLERETEAAGYPISADPFEPYERLAAQLRARAPFDLRRRDVGQDLFVAGYIDSVEREGFPVDERSAAALDCEGLVVRVARGARSFLGEDLGGAGAACCLECEGPALLFGEVKRQDQEIYLEARALYSLEDALEWSRAVRRMTLDVGGEDRRTIGWIADLLKAYRGETEVFVGEGRLAPSPHSAKLRGLKTLFCPPVYGELTQRLLPEQIRLEDQDGAAIRIPDPVILR